MSGLPDIDGKQNIRLNLQFYQLIKCRFTVTKMEDKSHLTFLKATSLACFVKENYHLTQERSTVVTIASSSNAIKTPPLEFVFKGKGIKVKVNPPERATAQWSD